MKVVTSIYHLTIKFPTLTGVGQVNGCQSDSRVCYNQALKVAERGSVSSLEEAAQLEEEDSPMTDVEEGKRKRPEVGSSSICNMISIEELLKNYFEGM